MTSLLVLLGLLSVATMLSRRGSFAFVTHAASTPLLLGLGFALSPSALAFMTPSTMEALTPALRVGVAWLAVLAGLAAGARVAQPSDAASQRTRVVDGAHAALASVVVAAVCVGAAWLALTRGGELGMARDDVLGGGLLALGAALLLGGIIAPSNAAVVAEAMPQSDVSAAARRLRAMASREDIVGALALVFAVALLPVAVGSPDAPAPPALAACIAPALGLVLAAAQLLIGGQKDDATTRQIALMGIVVLAAGLAARTHVPEAATTFITGFVLARTEHGRLLLQRLAPTERPVRLVVVALLGTHLGLTLPAAILGVILAVARLVAKSVVVATWRRGAPPLDELSASTGSSATTLVFGASAALALGSGLEVGLVAAVAVAVVVADAATFLARLWVRARAAPAGDEAGDIAGAEAR